MLFKIDSSVFAPMRRLNKIEFNPNNEVSEFKLSGIHFPVLTEITMFRIEIFDSKLFDNFGKLESLTASGASLRLIHGDAFFGMKSLSWVFLQNNFIKSLNLSMSNLADLEKVVIENNQIESFHSKEFANCKRLKQLRIAGNKLKLISLSNLKTIAPQLTFVNFANTTPELIYSFKFSSLINLETLDLSMNSIKDKRIDINEMTKMRFLTLKDSFRGSIITYELS
jgi:Leucine-rich repeat (LRR) protein